MTKPKPKPAPVESAPDNVTVITVSQALAAYNKGDLATVERYCDIAGDRALQGIVAMRDELRQKG